MMHPLLTINHEVALRQYVNKIRGDAANQLARGVLKGELVELFDAYDQLRADVARLTEENKGYQRDLSNQIHAKANVAKEAVNYFAAATAERDALRQGIARFRGWMIGYAAEYEYLHGMLEQLDTLLPPGEGTT